MHKISKLVSALLERTEKGLVAWRETVDEDAFHYSLADSTVGIAEHGGTYSITIYNDIGRVVELMTDEELEKIAGGGDNRELMQHLYAAARRKALQADTTLDGILSQLGVEA